MDWEENTSYEQKHFRETINRSCKVSTAQMTRKRNNRLREVLFPAFIVKYSRIFKSHNFV